MIKGRNIQRVTEGLGSAKGTGDGILFRYRLLKKELQEFPSATTQTRQKIPVIEKSGAALSDVNY